MTQGNILDDKTTKVVAPDGRTYNVGYYQSKIWSGGDNPAGTAPRYDGVSFANGSRFKPRKPPKRGRLQEHAYTMTLTEHRDNMCIYRVNGGSPRYGSFLDLWGSPTSFGPYWDSNDELRLISELRSSIQGSDFNIGTFLAEGRESLQTIAEVAGRIDAAYRFARKGNFVKAAKSVAGYKDPRPSHNAVRRGAKVAAGNWNEFQYGMKPMLQDARESAEFLAHLMSAPPQQTYTVSRSKRFPLSSGYWAFHDPMIYSVKIKAIVRCVDRLQLSGLIDPAQVIWEKVPYSFVADWFIPVGNFLSAVNTARSVSGTFVRTEYQRYKVSSNRAHRVLSDYTFDVYPDMHWTSVRVKRTISSGLSVPSPKFREIGDVFRPWQHAVNAVSLLTSRAFKRTAS